MASGKQVYKEPKAGKHRKRRVRNFFKKNSARLKAIGNIAVVSVGLGLIGAGAAGILLKHNKKSQEEVAYYYEPQEDNLLPAGGSPAFANTSDSSPFAISKPDPEMARILIQKLGLKKNKETLEHFSQATTEIGAPLIEKLYREFGIEYFGRYTGIGLSAANQASLLRVIAANSLLENDPKPVLLVATNQYDHNGAFGYMGLYKYEDFQNDFKILAVEGRSDKKLIQRILHVGTAHGKIKFLVLGGHGNPTRITLGKGPGAHRAIDTRDKKLLRRIRPVLADNAKIILNSCKTGAWANRGIGHCISKNCGAETFAPQKVCHSFFLRYDAQKDQLTVDYDYGTVKTRVYRVGCRGDDLSPFAKYPDGRRVGQLFTGKGGGIIIVNSPNNAGEAELIEVHGIVEDPYNPFSQIVF